MAVSESHCFQVQSRYKDFFMPESPPALVKAELGLSKALLPARGTRKLTKSNMLWNDSCPTIRGDPQTFDVFVDSELAPCEPARVLPLAQRYLLR
jgi:urease subunit alpha